MSKIATTAMIIFIFMFSHIVFFFIALALDLNCSAFSASSSALSFRSSSFPSLSITLSTFLVIISVTSWTWPWRADTLFPHKMFVSQAIFYLQLFVTINSVQDQVNAKSLGMFLLVPKAVFWDRGRLKAKTLLRIQKREQMFWFNCDKLCVKRSKVGCM